MGDGRERWALILGASSGMGQAAGLAFARAGYRIAGVHLDGRAGLPHVQEVKAAIVAAGSEALFINMNAADDEKRADALDGLRARFDQSIAEGRRPHLRVVMHSLAFGSLLPFLADDPKDRISRKQLEMTLDVMASSLVYWVQDLWRGGFLEAGSKVFAMTSEGSARMIPFLRGRVRCEGGPRVQLPPAGHGVRPARLGRRGQRDPGRRHRHAGDAQDPRGRPHGGADAGSQPARAA